MAAPSVAVIGGGAIGLSTALHLAELGADDVVVLERSHVAAESSGLSVGIIETQYVEPLDIELRVRSMELFRRLERDRGLHVVRNGYLRLVHSADRLPAFEASMELQRELGVADACVLDAAGVQELVPDLRCDDVAGGLWGPSDGYIDGHLEKIAEGSGLGQSTAANVTQRLAGSDQHVVVVRERVMLSGWVWLLALLGGIYRFRTRHADHAAAVLAVAPIPLFLLPYGGEVLLRLYFFMLPFVAFFAAALLVPSEAEQAGGGTRGRPAILRTVRDTVVFGLAGSLLLAASFVARYGNERMDAYSPAETAAVHELYRIAPLGSYLLAETNYLPWKYQDYEWSKTDPTRRRHKYLSLANEWSAQPNKSTGDMVKWAAQSLRANATLRRPAGFVILTASQRAHEEILGGLAPSTLDEFEMLLMRSGKFELVYSNRDAKIYVRNPGK